MERDAAARSFESETPALGRGQMGRARRVTEGGATPQEPRRTVRQGWGSLTPHPNLEENPVEGKDNPKSRNHVFLKKAAH